MAVFSNLQIARALEEGHIVCEPFNPKHVAHASLDVTLGYYYYRTERTGYHSVYNPFDETDVERYFDGPYQSFITSGMVRQTWDDAAKRHSSRPPGYRAKTW
jgi:deoxycytidine triphosphate deaminase